MVAAGGWRTRGQRRLHPVPSITRNHRRQRLVPVLILLAAVVVPALLLAVLTLHDKSHQRHEAATLVSEASRLGRAQALRIVQLALQAVERMDDATATLGWPQVQARRTALQAEFRRIEQDQPCRMALILVRPDGRVAAAGGGNAAAPLAEATALESLRLPRDGSRAPVFEAMPRDLAARWPGLLVGRARGLEGRPFDGMVFAALAQEAFATAWEQDGNPATRFALVREDGTVLLRPGASAQAPAVISPEDPLRLAIGRGDQRLVVADPFADGAPQILAWERLGDLPVFLVHALPVAEQERLWRGRMGVNFAISLAFAVLLGFLALRAWRGQRTDEETLRRLEANAAELQTEIARRETAEENLRNAQRLEGLGRLTGGVAHDFNNLLTAILGTARALERHLGDRADERTKRLIAATVTAVDRGARLNASLLAFARRQPLTLTTVDANALLRDFLPLLRRALDESITVELALDQKLPTCSADAAQLEAAVLNLAINARDAMPRGGTMRIVTRRAWLQEQALEGNPDAQPGPYVAIEVRDTGQGMVPEVRERAFEPFFTTKAAGQGTGLGLSQVFGFIRQIGGHVAIQSAPGRGTTVSLYLPLGSATAAPAGGTAAPARLPAHSGAGLSVLVVEDEPVVRAVAVDMLQDAGFAVLAAHDGPTALALLEEGAQVDILFSDVVMPGGMTGVDLAREARRLRPGIGVLLASGYAAEALAQHGGAGEFELIGKPYDVETVLTRIAAQRPRHAAAAQ